MFVVDNKHKVIAPPLSGYTAAREMIGRAGLSVTYHGRHTNEERPDLPTILILRPFMSWLESVWKHRKAEGVWHGFTRDAFRDLDPQYFSTLVTYVVTREPGSHTEWLQPYVAQADYIVSSYRLRSGLRSALQHDMPADLRMGPAADSKLRVSWPPMTAREWHDTEPAMHALERFLLNDCESGCLLKAPGWPAVAVAAEWVKGARVYSNRLSLGESSDWVPAEFRGIPIEWTNGETESVLDTPCEKWRRRTARQPEQDWDLETTPGEIEGPLDETGGI